MKKSGLKPKKIRAKPGSRGWRMCYRKRRMSKTKAEAAVKSMKKRKCPGHEFLHVYPCPICNHWHVGKENVDEILSEKINLTIKAKRCMIELEENL